MESLTYFNIQRFCVNDGPGIRTTVFLKGCPLHCLWCHNPESKSPRPDLFYAADKCVLCTACERVCPHRCHRFEGGVHYFDRTACVVCGKCADVCMADALELAGCNMPVEQIFAEVKKDVEFYRTSGGGMTLSGGEPMLQYDGTLALLSLAKANNMHTCMETCGFADAEKYRQVAPYVDIFLYDYKLTDSMLHQKYTGVSNTRILENLHMLDSLGAQMILRCPIIPTINDTDTHFAGIARTAESLTHISEIHIEPYHPLGSSKSERLGLAYPLSSLAFPEKKTINGWIERIRAATHVPVRQA